MKLTATDNEVLNPGVYLARLVQIEERAGTYVTKTGETESGTYLNYKFAILSEGHQGAVVYANSSTNFGPQAKARKWFSNILERPIKAGEDVTEEMLVGRECLLALEVENDKQGNPRNVVASILPASTSTPQKTDSSEATGLLREFTMGKKVLGWRADVFAAWLEREANSSQPFEKLPLNTQREVMDKLRDLIEHADQYDENGGLKFD